MARETPGMSQSPRSTGAWRFHSVTSNHEKHTCIKDFSRGFFPVVSCTMALGLGQNWKRVQMVVTVGRGDPSSISQMIGRCGRDGRPGLAVVFGEKMQRNGKNRLDQFTRGTPQSDADWMDALHITSMCLRVEISMDNLYGYIPLWADDPNYIEECDRENNMKMETCQCSNFAPKDALRLIGNLPSASVTNFDSILKNKFVPTKIHDLKIKYPKRCKPTRKRKMNDLERSKMDQFKVNLLHDLYEYFYMVFKKDWMVLPKHLYKSNQEVENTSSAEGTLSRPIKKAKNSVDKEKQNEGSTSSQVPSNLKGSNKGLTQSHRPATKKALAEEKRRSAAILREERNQIKKDSERARREQISAIMQEVKDNHSSQIHADNQNDAIF
ncbi:hypothetical protein PCANC_26211 [Puccinia coronata f. sp. avenae]|uniref:DNA 3'-5' helicase n=1 Tax=Puccinia coronata f. sp. avenae TaxID=200324 RepID=A0A2N5TMJ7_9BASI|nr:hypothetical protein PCANC_26211 [Puccinia coronata f. sp. avenae]